MMFSTSKKSFQSLRSENFLRADMYVYRQPKKPLGFLENTLFSLSKATHRGIFNVFGRFTEGYLRNLASWKKSKNRFGLIFFTRQKQGWTRVKKLLWQ
jgi:hypothetical protein